MNLLSKRNFSILSFRSLTAASVDDKVTTMVLYSAAIPGGIVNGVQISELGNDVLENLKNWRCTSKKVSLAEIKRFAITNFFYIDFNTV